MNRAMRSIAWVGVSATFLIPAVFARRDHTVRVEDGTVRGVAFSAPANHNFSWKMTVVGIDRWEHVRGTQWPRRPPWTVKRFSARQFDWEVAVNRQNNEWRHYQVQCKGGLSRRGVGGRRPLGTADGLHIIEVLRSKLGDGEFHSWYLDRTDAGPHQGEVLWVEPYYIGHMEGDPRSVRTLIEDGVLAPGEYRYLGQVHSHPSDDVPSGRDLDIMLLYNMAVARDNPGSDDYYVVTGSRIFQYRPGENYWLVSEDL